MMNTSAGSLYSYDSSVPSLAQGDQYTEDDCIKLKSRIDALSAHARNIITKQMPSEARDYMNAAGTAQRQVIMSTVVGLYGLAESLFKNAGKAAAQTFSRSRAPFAARGDYIIPRHPVSTDVALVNARSAGDVARRSSLGSEAVADAVQYGGTAAGLLWALDSPSWLNDAFTELDTAFGMTDLNLKTFQRQQSKLQDEYDANCPPSN